MSQLLLVFIKRLYMIVNLPKYMTIFTSKSKINILLFVLITFILSSCGIYKPVDARKVPVNVNDRVEKNIQQGKGYRLFGAQTRGGTFDFATSNEMWRASLDLLDFTPLSNVDYSGGIIITDWFADANSSENEQIKITVKFLSNEIRADGIEIIIHKKICDELNRCKISKLQSDLSNDIKVAILKDAAILKEQSIEENPNQDYKTLDEAIDR